MMTRGKGVKDADNLMMSYLICRAHEAANSRRQKILTYLNYAYMHEYISRFGRNSIL